MMQLRKNKLSTKMNYVWIGILFSSSILQPGLGAAEDKLCAYSKQAVVKFSKLENGLSEDGDGSAMTGNLLDSNTTEKCPKGSDYCYALWQEDPQNKTVIILLAQGCWDSSGEIDCGPSECISNKRPPKALNNTKFCCCFGNMCNANVSNIDVPITEESAFYPPAFPFVEHASYRTEVVVIALASICSIFIITIAAVFIFRLWSSSRKHSPDSVNQMESQQPPLPKFDINNLKIQEVVGRGRFGSVWKGALNEHTVAVKIFVAQNKQYFLNERDIYCLPCMDQSCLPKFIGSDDRIGPDNRTEYLLVLSYAPYGCLQEFLRHGTVDWPTLCKMSQTLTRGLSHLHTEIKKGDLVKPCIAHRDLNSRNVLVKLDGSCMLCDLGFAIRISGCKYFQNGEEQVAETTSLADVGTLRYMAPEVLEGAVNLRDCESSLKQIDVYALGLVLWEIATRCSDLYQGMEVPPYKLPFESEVGLHPSMEQMQVLVTRNKARPLFPEIWKASNPAVRSLKETIEDCWDHDAEARLTALCVEERLSELPLLWERHKAGNTVPGVSPTINQTSCNQRPPAFVCLSSSSSGSQVGNGIFPDSSEKNSQSANRRSSLSEATSDTLLTISPIEPISPLLPVSNNMCNGMAKNNCTNNMVSQLLVPLQPHQGRNPCMERNLMVEPTEELGIKGNMLLEKGKDIQSLTRNTDSSDTIHLLGNNESNAALSNDASAVTQSTTRAYNPIPYVQNAVHMAGAMPKQPNLPGNGHHSLTMQKEVSKKEKKNSNPFSIFGKKKRCGESSFRRGLRNFLDRRKNSCSSGTLAEDEQPLKGSPVSEKTNSPIQESNCQVNENLESSMYSRNEYRKLSPVFTEVCIINQGANGSVQQAVVRPVANGHVPGEESSSAVLRHRGSLPLFQKAPRENNKDINDNCSSEGSLDHKQVRPNTLPVKAFKPKPTNSERRYDGIRMSDGAGTTKQMQKVPRRVKTPFEIKNGRFSLHNDRIMASQDLEPSSGPLQELNGSAVMSLSLPLNIDSLYEENNIAQCSQLDLSKHSSPTV